MAPDREGKRLRITWAPATAGEGASPIAYRVYAAPQPGKATSRPAVLTTEPGATSALIEAAPGKLHFIVVRAVGASGVEDANTVEKSATVVPDVTPPAFAGVKTAAAEGLDRVVLTWEPALDDLTPPEGIRYAVYAGEPIDFGRRLAETTGQTRVEVTNVASLGKETRFAVRAIDAGDNRDANAATAAVTFPDQPPVFAGCGDVDAVGGRRARISWAPATDDVTPANEMSYDVFVATTAGAQMFDGAPTVNVVGATAVELGGLMPNTKYHVVCRARDKAGKRDENRSEKTFTTMEDGTAPTFAGIVGANLDPVARTVGLTWTAGTDDRTQPAKLVYLVYESKTAGIFDFAAPPRAVSMPGATDITLTNLPSATTLYWVVRARDEALNTDSNVVSADVTTPVSYRLDVQPIFAKSCAVVGCHISGVPVGGLSLSSSVAFDSIVGVTANQRPPGWPTTMNRVTPFDTSESYLLRKVLGVPGTFAGSVMPAPGTGNVLSDTEKALLQKWIEQGAERN